MDLPFNPVLEKVDFTNQLNVLKDTLTDPPHQLTVSNTYSLLGRSVQQCEFDFVH